MARTVIVRNTLNATLDAARRVLSEALEESAEAGVTLAKALCPVRTGNLRGTIEQHEERLLRRVMTEGGPTAESPNGAHYALHQEFGAEGRAARPHFTPGTEEARRVLGEASVRKVREALG